MVSSRVALVTVSLCTALGSNAPASLSAQVGGAGGPSGLNLNISQMPTPLKGKLFRFSLCSGKLLELGEVSTPCNPTEANAAKTVSGAAQNSLIVFRLQATSFLPPGFHLDGDGVISGTTDADVSKLNIRICAIQVGAIGSNFNCQGQQVGFAGGNAAVLGNTIPNVAPGLNPGAGAGAGIGKTVAVVGGVAGGTVAALVYVPKLVDSLSGPECTSQETALNTSTNSLVNAVNNLAACGSSQSCFNSRQPAVDNAVQKIINAMGDLCLCMGSTELSAADKAEVADLFQQLRSLGTNPGNLPSCFR